MVKSFWFAVPVASVLGFLSGCGIGGGSLLMLWLTLIVKAEPPQARMLNLLFFIPCAVFASIFRFRQKKIPLRYILPVAIPGCICSALCTWFFSGTNAPILRKGFGILLLVTGLREIFYRERKPK